ALGQGENDRVVTVDRQKQHRGEDSVELIDVGDLLAGADRIERGGDVEAELEADQLTGHLQSGEYDDGDEAEDQPHQDLARDGEDVGEQLVRERRQLGRLDRHEQEGEEQPQPDLGHRRDAPVVEHGYGEQRRADPNEDEKKRLKV